jgi:hypothetical protein
MSNGIDRRDVLKGASAAVIMAMLREAHALEPQGARRPGALDSSGKRAFSANQTVTALVPDRLYRIGCMVRAERLSWLPQDLDAFEPLNAYLLTDKDNCVFFEMGMPIMQPAIESAIDMIGDRKVYVNFSRNEADCIGNMGYILGTCKNPTLLYGTAGGILEWINDPHVSMLEVRDFLGRIPIESAKNGESKRIGELDLTWFDAGSKMMLMTQWAYEKTSRCLFTSESFGWRHAPTADAPPIVESAKGLPSVDTVAREMVERMNWMREAEYPGYVERFESIFKQYDVQMIAPVHGCVIKGREAVDAHVKLAVKAMRAASKLPDTERKRYV